MLPVLFKAFTLIFIMALGYLLKRLRFFSPSSYTVVSKIVMNITLPAAIITGFASFVFQSSIIGVVFLGFLCNVLLLIMGYFVARKRDNRTKAYCMLNFPGYNIGAFTMPFVQSFLGPFGIVITSMFDAGNSIMCTGGSYAITSSVVGAKQRSRVFDSVKKLLSSVPFDTYMIMLALSLFRIHMPSSVFVLSSTVGNANAFLAMLMIGMMFEMTAKPEYIRQVLLTLSIRYAFAISFALLFYFFMPYSLAVRRVLVIVVFAPLSILTPIFTEKSDGDPALSSLTGSLSILISIAIITMLLVTMHIG